MESALIETNRGWTAKQLANRYSTTIPTILDWYHKGVIPAIVAEGRVFRFDPGAVEEALIERAKNRSGKEKA
jgi:predicted site-specific integrase-resolvase